MEIDVIIAVKAPSLDDACALVEDTLGIPLEPHNSLHYGGDYFRFEQRHFQLILRDNIDLLDDEPAEPKFPDFPFLLYVNGVDEKSPILAKLQSAPELFVELRRRSA
jgi:hypothetical protein